jgi:hypothetical protein
MLSDDDRERLLRQPSCLDGQPDSSVAYGLATGEVIQSLRSEVASMREANGLLYELLAKKDSSLAIRADIIKFQKTRIADLDRQLFALQVHVDVL